MAVETTLWDIVDYLNTPEERALYLEAVFEDGDPQLVAHALDDVLRSAGMSKLEDGDPRLTTLLGVLKSLGLALSVHPVQPAE